MKHKCNYCETETSKSLSDFYLINWSAFRIGNQKTIIACDKHSDLLEKDMPLYIKGLKL